MRPARVGCMLARMWCAQYIILGACVVAVIIVSFAAAYARLIVRRALTLQERAATRARRLVLTAAKVATRWPGPGS